MKISLKTLFISVVAAGFLLGCESNPQNVDVKLKKSAPEPTFTIYTSAINRMGMMTDIYNAPMLKVMTTEVSDNTGTSVATSAEIPRDITEMVKSALNSIGGKITYIPYDPSFLSNNMAVGYSEFSNKLIPDVIVSGGITEFDRGLVTKGDGTNLGLSGTISGKSIGFAYDDSNKSSLARVTLDFNLVDFQTFAGIPRIQAINSIKLNKAVKETNIGFQIIGSSFGVKGDVKKVQGRHAAVRLLVQLSMLQIVGRYQRLPYWNLIPGASIDQVVVDRVLEEYYDMTQIEQIVRFQELLYIKNYNLNVTGEYDSATQQALQAFATEKGLADSGLTSKVYWELYNSIPITHEARHKRNLLLSGEASVAKVKRLAPPKKVAPPRRTMPKQEVAETGQLKIWTNKRKYRVGDTMDVMFSVDKPMFVRLMIVNSQGEVSTLFPNPMQSDNYLKPGKTYQIPPVGADFTLDIGGPVGTDHLKGVASKNPVPANVIYFDSVGNFDAGKMQKFPVRASTKVAITN
ncbi:MAG: DUF4384 domain-containing protein [Pseudomonadota bacterium]